MYLQREVYLLLIIFLLSIDINKIFFTENKKNFHLVNISWTETGIFHFSLHLTRPCVHFALTRAQICTQVDTSFRLSHQTESRSKLSGVYIKK